MHCDLLRSIVLATLTNSMIHYYIVLPCMPRRRWEDSIRMDLKEIDINMRNWVDSAQDRDYCRALVNAVP